MYGVFLISKTLQIIYMRKYIELIYFILDINYLFSNLILLGSPGIYIRFRIVLFI